MPAFTYSTLIMCVLTIQLSSFVFIGYSAIIPKVKVLVPVLVNCFEEFVPAIQGGPSLDAQWFGCMMYLLQSIDLSIRFFIYSAVGDETISSISKVLFKRLLVVFPLDPVPQYSGKVLQVLGWLLFFFYLTYSRIKHVFLADI